jgi:hypothetical protein
MILRPWCCAPPFLDNKDTGYHKVLYCVFFFRGAKEKSTDQVFPAQTYAYFNTSAVSASFPMGTISFRFVHAKF